MTSPTESITTNTSQICRRISLEPAAHDTKPHPLEVIDQLSTMLSDSRYEIRRALSISQRPRSEDACLEHLREELREGRTAETHLQRTYNATLESVTRATNGCSGRIKVDLSELQKELADRKAKNEQCQKRYDKAQQKEARAAASRTKTCDKISYLDLPELRKRVLLLLEELGSLGELSHIFRALQPA